MGRLDLYEPMIRLDSLDSLDGEMEVESKTPDEYFAADDYPTTYVMEPDDDGGLFVSMDEFWEFPGPSE